MSTGPRSQTNAPERQRPNKRRPKRPKKGDPRGPRDPRAPVSTATWINITMSSRPGDPSADISADPGLYLEYLEASEVHVREGGGGDGEGGGEGNGKGKKEEVFPERQAQDV